MSPKKGPFRKDNSLPLPISIFQGTLARFRGVTSFEKAVQNTQTLLTSDIAP